MKFYISKKELRDLYEMNLESNKIISMKWYEPRIVKDFLDWVSIIKNARDIRDFLAFWFLHYEKLKPPFKDNERTIRVGAKWWRIYFRLEEDWTITIIDIFDYNKHEYWK